MAQRLTHRTRELRGFLRPGSLRFKALALVVGLVLAPLAWVWGTAVLDFTSRVGLQRDVEGTSTLAARRLRAGTLDAAAMAHDHRVRIRLLGPDGTVRFDADHEGRLRWTDTFGEIFFGPDGRPDPRLWDSRRAPLPDRPEVRDAADGTVRGRACTVEGDLLTCAVAQTVQSAEGPVLLHVQASRARSTRALYADRFQLLQLTLFVLLLAVPLTLWLGIRWVRPLESLRDQALARTRGRVSTEPLRVTGDDEYAELADAFNTLLEAIERRNHANETFAADLAHELKNPIAAVRTAAEALAPGKPLTEARAARLHRILDDSSQRMSVVMERFLELARAEAGLANREREPLDLTELARAVVHTLGADPRFESVRLTVDGPSATVVGTPERLETTLRNLVANAASFAGENGRVHVQVDLDGTGVALSVTDSGPGIEPDDLPRIFDRYFSRRQGGTGLGLPLSRAIVQAHGGTLVAANAPEGGAVFTLRLPR